MGSIFLGKRRNGGSDARPRKRGLKGYLPPPSLSPSRFNMALPILLLLLAGAHGALAHTSSVDVPSGLVTRDLVRDAYGYSVEPVWLSSFANTSLMATLLQQMADVTGQAPPVRIGGTTSDETTLYESLAGGAASNGTSQFNITTAWFASWADYFPAGTEVTFALNFAANGSGWATARAEAAAAWEALGSKLALFELGNEVDHFVAEGWRAQGWGVDEYIPQFDNLTAAIQGAEWYTEAGDEAPKFQAAVFADPPWVPVCTHTHTRVCSPGTVVDFRKSVGGLCVPRGSGSTLPDCSLWPMGMMLTCVADSRTSKMRSTTSTSSTSREPDSSTRSTRSSRRTRFTSTHSRPATRSAGCACGWIYSPTTRCSG